MSKNISNTGLDDEGSKHLIVAKTWFTELSIGKDSHGLAMIYQELTRKIRKSWNFTKVGFRWGSMKVPIRICTLKKRQVLIRVMKGGGRMCKWQPIGPSIHPSTYKSLQISSRAWKWKGLAVYWNQLGKIHPFLAETANAFKRLFPS